MNPIVIVHVAAGSLALIAGAGALIARKGGRSHGRIGTAFFAAMLVMTATGATMAALRPERITVVIGIFTCYLVATAWSVARRRDGKAGWFETIAILVPIAAAAANYIFAQMASAAPNHRLDSLPPQPAYGFAALAALAALLDLNYILRRGVTGRQRITRHLWRMCTALLIAAMSFFLGQQDEFPREWRGHFLWFVPPLAILAAFVFWAFRARLGQKFSRWPPGPKRAPAE
jgi:hypothetical protein